MSVLLGACRLASIVESEIRANFDWAPAFLLTPIARAEAAERAETA
jgi:hypothetical protein